MSTVLVPGALTGCALLDLDRDCTGTDARVEEVAEVGIFRSRPAEAGVARGFEKADTGCWADSGDVVVYAERTYTFPGTRAEVAAHYRTVAPRDGWSPDPEAVSEDLCFTKGSMRMQIVFLTAERLAEDGHGGRLDLTTGAGYSIGIDSYENSGSEAGC